MKLSACKSVTWQNYNGGVEPFPKANTFPFFAKEQPTVKQQNRFSKSLSAVASTGDSTKALLGVPTFVSSCEGKRHPFDDAACEVQKHKERDEATLASSTCIKEKPEKPGKM